MTGQGAVLNHLNRENAKRLHRKNGLPPPDFAAAERRIQARRAPAHHLSASEVSSKCAYVRARLARLTASQMTVYRRACG